MKKEKRIIGFKAFDKGLKCRGFQFEENKEFEDNNPPELCSNGFHFCENPLDVLDFYDLTTSEFAMVESVGETISDGKKSVTNKIKIKSKIDLSGFIKASFDFLFEKTKEVATSGYYSKVATSGDSSQVATSGDSSQVATSGDYSKVATSGYSSKVATSGDYSKVDICGKESIGANIGINGKIKGVIGTWITLSEYNNNNKPIYVLSVQIDGEKIKADTWYMLKNKKMTECID